MYLKFNLLGLC